MTKPLSQLNKQRYQLPWGPWSALIGTLAIFFASQLLAGIVIAAVALGRGLSGDQLLAWVTDTVTGRFIYVLAVEIAVLGLLYWFLSRRRAHPADIGLKSPRLADVGLALLGYAAYFAAFLVIVQLVQSLAPGLDLSQEQEIGFSRDASGQALLYIFISLVVLPPIVEEILVRGFLYSGLRTRLGIIQAGLISSTLFAAAHLQFGSAAPLLWVAAIDTFVLSTVLVYLRETTGSLWSPIGVHMLKNGTAFVALFVLNIA